MAHNKSPIELEIRGPTVKVILVVPSPELGFFLVGPIVVAIYSA